MMISSLNIQRLSMNKCKKGLCSLVMARKHLLYPPYLISFKPSCASYCKINSGLGRDNKQNQFSTSVGDGDEDFFGIPSSFKLQHATVPKTDFSNRKVKSSLNVSQRPQSITPLSENEESKSVHDSENNRDTEYNHISERFISRREKRRRDVVNRLGTLSTNFGYISIDDCDPTTRSLPEKNAVAERLWANMSNDNVPFKSKTSTNQNVAGKDISHENPLPKHRDEQMIQHESISSSSVSSNYFDEMYFQGLAEFSPEKNQSNADFLPHEDSYLDQRKADDHDHIQTNQQSSECDTGNINSVLGKDKFRNPGTFGNFVMEQRTLNKNKKRTNKKSNPHKTSSSDIHEDFNFIDEYYFGNSVVRSKDVGKVNENTDDDSDMNFMESQFFTIGKSENATPFGLKNETCDGSTFEHVVDQYTEGKELPQLLHPVENVSSSAGYADEQEERSTRKTYAGNNLRPVTTNKKFLQQLSRSQRAAKTSVSSDESENAYDVAMRIRQQITSSSTEIKTKVIHRADPQVEDGVERGKYELDSKGFRILSDQIRDLKRMTSADVVNLLRKKIIFDHDDFLALDKPYGLPCLAQPGERLSLTNLLPTLCASLPRKYKSNDLHLVHGLDHDITGVVILAKSPEIAYILRGMYDNNEIIQRFWAITKGIPQPKTGIIDIPIGEGKIGNIYKMVLRPQYSRVPKYIARTSKAPSQRAVTEYKVLGSHLQAALVECELHTNRVKHQIRVHMASGLNTPILGDHKYSHFSKLAPQKLHPDMLKLLKVRQAKVRHIAMHLHCRSVVLTNYNGRMIFLTSRPPLFFKDNLRSLKIPMSK